LDADQRHDEAGEHGGEGRQEHHRGVNLGQTIGISLGGLIDLEVEVREREGPKDDEGHHIEDVLPDENNADFSRHPRPG